MAVARSRRRVIDSFTSQAALSPERAIAFHPLRGIDDRMFQRLLRNGILQPAENRRFYLDAAALAASDAARGRIKTAALTGVGLIAALAAAAALLG